MTIEIKLTSQFKKQYKKVKKDPRWQPIFNHHVSFANDQRSPWKYVLDCLIEEQTIPNYFYEHQLILPKSEQQIKQRLKNKHLEIHILELHFDGHNGDHLLIYGKTQEAIYLLAIGTHNNLFG